MSLTQQHLPRTAAAIERLRARWRELQDIWRDHRRAIAEEKAENRFCHALLEALDKLPQHTHPADARAARRALMQAGDLVLPRRPS